MAKKRQKEYEDEIRALNSILLEMKDHANALGHERDYWKKTAAELLKMVGFEVPETDGPLLRDDDGKLIGIESLREVFLKLKNESKKP